MPLALFWFFAAVMLIGGVAVTLGCFVEPLEINFMVGQAFAIAAAIIALLRIGFCWRLPLNDCLPDFGGLGDFART